MDRITVTRPVILKVRLTEKYKEALLQRLAAAIEEADREVQRIEFRAKRLDTDKKPRPASAEMEEIEKARREKIEIRERLKSQYEAVNNLALGAEIIHGRTEGLVEIGVGDDARVLNAVEVVIEEGKIIALREQT